MIYLSNDLEYNDSLICYSGDYMDVPSTATSTITWSFNSTIGSFILGSGAMVTLGVYGIIYILFAGTNNLVFCFTGSSAGYYTTGSSVSISSGAISASISGNTITIVIAYGNYIFWHGYMRHYKVLS